MVFLIKILVKQTTNERKKFNVPPKKILPKPKIFQFLIKILVKQTRNEREKVHPPPKPTKEKISL